MRVLVIAMLVVAAPGWLSFQSVRYQYRVSYPSSWHRVNTSLTPHLSDPHEILTAGTGPYRSAGRAARKPPSAHSKRWEQRAHL